MHNETISHKYLWCFQPLSTQFVISLIKVAFNSNKFTGTKWCFWRQPCLFSLRSLDCCETHKNRIESNLWIFFYQNTSWANSTIVDLPFHFFKKKHIIYFHPLLNSAGFVLLWALCSVIESDGNSLFSGTTPKLLAYWNKKAKTSRLQKPN